ncbi:MAG: CHRD domain-containing protein [Pseudomonadota bacterium]|nr:CHRD domain-containing protein [Pseudomonadota bacterium]
MPPSSVITPAPSTAQPSPVPPTQPVAQPLPPVGTPQQPTPPGPSDASPADPRAHLITFTTRLNGASAVPPTRSSGSGQIDALYNASTGLLRWRASWSGLSGTITGVNFHGPAGENQTAPITLVWPAPFGPSYEGHATLQPQQAQDLLNGRWYVNIQTSLYPAGEVRGQLRVVH